MATKYTKWTENLPNNHKIYKHLPLQDPPMGFLDEKKIWQP
jgi:hypothetical protein